MKGFFLKFFGLTFLLWTIEFCSASYNSTLCQEALIKIPKVDPTYEIATSECLENSFMSNSHSLSASCLSNSTQFNTNCTTGQGELCKIRLKSSNTSANFPVDWTQYYCLAKSCDYNNGLVALEKQATVLVVATHISLSYAKSVCLINFNNGTILTTPCSLHYVCGLETGYGLLIVIVVFAIVIPLVVFLLVFLIRRRQGPYTILSEEEIVT